MDGKTAHNDVFEIDLQRLLSAVWKKIWLVVIVGVVAAVATYAATAMFVTPLYQASAKFYVNNTSLSVGDTSLSISSGDIAASKTLVDSYIVILTTRDTLNDVIDFSGVDRTYSQLKSMISAADVNDTEIFQVTVTSPDPEEAKQITDAIAYILPGRISGIVEGTSAKVVEYAVTPTAQSSPNCVKNATLGCVIGLCLTMLAIILREMFDVIIRTEEDIAKGCKYPVLAAVPNISVASKGGYYSGYGSKKSKKSLAARRKSAQVFVGGEIPFAASEAYKLLRTKVLFSFAGDNACRVIGVSSALAGEGKSLTASNLAYSLAEMGRRVLLIDCDMRRPSQDQKLPIQKTPGLADYLSGQSDSEAIFQTCRISEEDMTFYVVAAGSNPPNPIELLGSSKMSKLVTALRKAYDYVILDLPPVVEVSDAMAVSKEIDGVLLVARENHGNHVDLAAVVREFEFVGTKILGVVYNCAQERGGRYGAARYSRHGRYGRQYRYYKSYEKAKAESNGNTYR